mmetsp:Transcript_1463/g.3697  ORF Transcript_1463/g.3697 Transcript_1463/m.3697 type:complete len:383 (+) Transcript_1463:111-1259(+)
MSRQGKQTSVQTTAQSMANSNFGHESMSMRCGKSSAPVQRVLQAVTNFGGVLPAHSLCHGLLDHSNGRAGGAEQSLLRGGIATCGAQLDRYSELPRRHQETPQVQEKLEKGVRGARGPVGDREEVEEVHHVVIQVRPERLCIDLKLFVVDDPPQGNLIQALQLPTAGPKLLDELPVNQQPQHGGEGLDVAQLLFCHKLGQLRELRDIHGEEVGADAQDAMQQEHPRRGALVVSGAVVVAEADVIHEGAVGMLHLEVALVEHEVGQRQVHRRRRRDRAVALLDELQSGVGPMCDPRQLLPQHGARQGALDREEDGAVQREGGVLLLNDTPRVVDGLAPSNGGLPLRIQHRNHNVALDVDLPGSGELRQFQGDPAAIAQIDQGD